MGHGLLEKLADKSITREKLAEKVRRDFDLLPEIIDGVSSTKPSVRYGCGKILMDLSEDQPAKLCPYMDFFISLLDGKYRILRWVAIAVIANLTRVDSEDTFNTIFDKYFSLLNDEYMVTVANIVGHSSTIAQAKPRLIPRITKKLLEVENIKTSPHLTPECKNVIAEKAISSFDAFFDKVENKSEVVSFVKRQLHKSRKTLQATAEKFLNKWGC